jgi:hypothetical protein
MDVAWYGNVSHSVNHSCDPNLQVFNVFSDNLDTCLPWLALFSARTIHTGEELNFDYQMKGSGIFRFYWPESCHREGSEMCANVEQWLAEVTLTEFSGNVLLVIILFFPNVNILKSIWDSYY